MPDERTDPLDFTAEERAAADTSIPDSQQWIKRDEEAISKEEPSVVDDDTKGNSTRKRASVNDDSEPRTQPAKPKDA
jgi:hypothetical protein